MTHVREELNDGETLVKSIDRRLVRQCNYGQLRDEIVKDRIVAGINNTGLTKRMFAKPNLDLATVIAMAKAWALGEGAVP